MLPRRNVLGIIKAIVSAHSDAWLKNFTAIEQFLPNGGFPITSVLSFFYLLHNRNNSSQLCRRAPVEYQIQPFYLLVLVFYGKNKFINSYTDVTGCTGEYCIMKDGKNVLIIPERNLLSRHDNEELYFGKLADELVRNRRTKLFLLDPTYFVTVPNTQYKINKDELLIVESILNETSKTTD